MTIYCISIKGTDFAYVGSSIYPKKRFKQHLVDLRGGRHANRVFQKMYLENPELEFQILENCSSENERLIKEQEWIWKLSRQYRLLNLRPATASFNVGQVRTIETKKKMSLAHLGNPGRKLSREESLKMNSLRAPNSQKQRQQCRLLGLASAKQVFNLTTGQTYASGKEAAKALQCSAKSISDACRGKLKRVRGFHLSYEPTTR